MQDVKAKKGKEHASICKGSSETLLCKKCAVENFEIINKIMQDIQPVKILYKRHFFIILLVTKLLFKVSSSATILVVAKFIPEFATVIENK